MAESKTEPEDVIHFIGVDTMSECGAEPTVIAFDVATVTCRDCIASLRNGEWIS